VHTQKWPEVRSEDVGEEKVTIVVSIDGKPRGALQISSQEERALGEKRLVETAKSQERVKKYLEGREIIRSVYVPGRIVNFVTE
jgi:leucyl-tRNA synthetase